MLISLARLLASFRHLPIWSLLARNERSLGLNELSHNTLPFHRLSRQQLPGTSPSSTQLSINVRHFSARKKEVVKAYYPSTPFDENVESSVIHLVDEDKKFQRNQDLKQVLARIDRSKYFVVQVVPGNTAEDVPPTCRLVAKDEIIEAARAKTQKNKKKGDTSKQIQLNWAIDLKDLAHRLERLKEFLSEGRDVEVMLAVKRRGKRASSAEAETVVRRVNEAAASVPGAQESRTREGNVGGVLRLFFRGNKASE